VLLVSIDTLRADHLGAYGYALPTTPTLDRLAAEGLLCRDTSAPAPNTLPSHATLLTGQLPSVHAVTDRGRTLSAARSASLAEALARAGYRTQAFTAGGFVKETFGLDRGFDGFAEIDPIRTQDTGYFRARARRYGFDLAARLLDTHGFEGVRRWLSAHAREPFFLFLHTYAVHDYDAPRAFVECEAHGCPAPPVPARTRTSEEAAAYDAAMRAHIVHNYDAALRFTDQRLGELRAHLEQLGLMERTLVVVTSDHGEEFFEHGHLQHGRTLYEELLSIPLVLRGPGVPAWVLARPAMLCDVAPTILARLGLPADERAQGLDLLGPDWPARSIWSEVDDRFAHKYALRAEDGRKAIHGPPSAGRMFPNARAWEHYDLRRDPGEQRDLAHALDASLRSALEETRRRLEALGDSFGAVGHGELAPETERELDDLGYDG
jgi:arylsulfatase A-like enzyme